MSGNLFPPRNQNLWNPFNLKSSNKDITLPLVLKKKVNPALLFDRKKLSIKVQNLSLLYSSENTLRKSTTKSIMKKYVKKSFKVDLDSSPMIHHFGQCLKMNLRKLSLSIKESGTFLPLMLRNQRTTAKFLSKFPRINSLDIRDIRNPIYLLKSIRRFANLRTLALRIEPNRLRKTTDTIRSLIYLKKLSIEVVPNGYEVYIGKEYEEAASLFCNQIGQHKGLEELGFNFLESNEIEDGHLIHTLLDTVGESGHLYFDIKVKKPPKVAIDVSKIRKCLARAESVLILRYFSSQNETLNKRKNSLLFQSYKDIAKTPKLDELLIEATSLQHLSLDIEDIKEFPQKDTVLANLRNLSLTFGRFGVEMDGLLDKLSSILPEAKALERLELKILVWKKTILEELINLNMKSRLQGLKSYSLTLQSYYSNENRLNLASISNVISPLLNLESLELDFSDLLLAFNDQEFWEMKVLTQLKHFSFSVSNEMDAKEKDIPYELLGRLENLENLIIRHPAEFPEFILKKLPNFPKLRKLIIEEPIEWMRKCKILTIIDYRKLRKEALE